jgi:hypothetical protein
MFSRQTVYHLSHTPSTLLLLGVLFFDRVLSFFPRLASDCHSPTHVSHVAEMTGFYHQIWLVGCDGVLLTFCLSDSET